MSIDDPSSEHVDIEPYRKPEPIFAFWRPESPPARLWIGYLASQLSGLLQLGFLALLTTRFDWHIIGRFDEYTALFLGASAILGVPFTMGVVASYFWYDPSIRRRGKTWWYTTVNFIFACIGAGFVLREGVICLIMASPLLILLMVGGLEFGFKLWSKPPFLQVSIFPLLLLLFIADATQPHLYRTQATTTFHSSAPPERLWHYVAGYPVNNRPADWWLWKIGLPMPLQSTGEPIVGGRRDCRFTGNVDIGERIVEAIPNRRLEFVIDRQPQHPEALHHFTLERGRIELLPDGHGGTILRGTSWYRLNVYPAAYFNLWTSTIVHQTHRRVFEYMSRLAEEKSPDLHRTF